MKEKAKELLAFIGRAWRGGIRGKIGLAMVLFAMFAFLRMFIGHATIPGFIADKVRLDRERATLAMEQEKLAAVDRHIHLIQTHSPDFIEELSQKHLNMGDPNLRILR